jgi:Ras-related GTP-binding protein C/D
LTLHSAIRRNANKHTFSENFRQIQERVTDRLLDSSSEYEQMPLNFHLTSVYDHSLHEAFSRVLHKLIASLPYLEELLNVFCAVRLTFFTV